MRARSASLRSMRYHSPEDPPPPNEPPPPEKPPPSENPPPPEKPPPEPDPQYPPDPGTRTGPAHCPRRLHGDRLLAVSDRMIMKAMMRSRITVTRSIAGADGSGRLAARCLYSSACPLSTATISSTPRVTPPAKSLARKRGRI